MNRSLALIARIVMPALATTLCAALSAYGQTSTPTAPSAPATTPVVPLTPTAPIDAPPPAPPAPAAPSEVVRVGDVNKVGIGKITDVEKGDNGCYLTLLNNKGAEFIEIGLMALCTQKPPFKGKKVSLEYRMEEIQATSCYGDPKCKTRETVPLIISVKEMN